MKKDKEDMEQIGSIIEPVQEDAHFKKVVDDTNGVHFYYKRSGFWKRKSSQEAVRNIIVSMYVVDYLLWGLTFIKAIDDFFAETTKGTVTFIGIYVFVPLVAMPIALKIYNQCLSSTSNDKIDEEDNVELRVQKYFAPADLENIDLNNQRLQELLQQKANKYNKKTKLYYLQILPLLAMKIAFVIAYTLVLEFFYKPEHESKQLANIFIDKAPDISAGIDATFRGYSWLLKNFYGKYCEQQKQNQPVSTTDIESRVRFVS